ncbi:hypothetical protein CNMCM8694_006634 [Aspergillus lentulus]|nr:hypothetical protein CNMCM8060_007056 [Aspergillus lentulus]KAF4184155.1 hypothetical protein CNMCM7927_008345 [Aspergillus lentulus]KAF4195203.1 hypothetical protein CNMCM8694_006634 [Aspergillus lentulus]
MAENPTCVINLRPQAGKFPEACTRLSQHFISEIRENVAGIHHAYPFVVSGKEEIIVIEQFVSSKAMFAYFNSEYHAALVKSLLPFAQEPIEIKSSANLSDLQKWKDNTPGEFTV